MRYFDPPAGYDPAQFSESALRTSLAYWERAQDEVLADSDLWPVERAKLLEQAAWYINALRAEVDRRASATA